MKFRRHDDLLRVVHIAGPVHNLLGLKLQSGQVDPTIEELDTLGSPNLSRADVVREVYAGVDDGNKELGADYKPARIQFVLSDSGPPSIYRTLAREATCHYARYMGSLEATRQGRKRSAVPQTKSGHVRTSQG